MRCKKCRKKVSKYADICPFCGSKVIIKRNIKLDSHNKILVILTAVQLIAVISLLVIPGNVSRALSYLDKKEYDKAIELIEENNSLFENNKISDKINDVLFIIESDYISEYISYDDAVKNLNMFENLSDDKLKNNIANISENINEINKSREYMKKGDEYLSKNDYANAINEYKKIKECDTKYYSIKEEKFKNIFDILSNDASKSNDISLNDIRDLKKEITDKQILLSLDDFEKETMLKQINNKIECNEYVGSVSALSLSIQYDKLTGSNKANEIDKMYQSYIDNCIKEKNYQAVVDIIDKDFETLTKNSNYFDLGKYEKSYSECAENLIKQYKDTCEKSIDDVTKLAENAIKYNENSDDKQKIIDKMLPVVKDYITAKVNSYNNSGDQVVFTENKRLSEAADKMINYDFYNLDDIDVDCNNLFLLCEEFYNSFDFTMDLGIGEHMFYSDGKSAEFAIVVRYNNLYQKIVFLVITIENK